MGSYSSDKPFHGTSVHVTWVVDPKDKEEFMKHFKTLFDVMEKEETCSFLEVFTSMTAPGEVKLIEHWTKPLDWLKANQVGKQYYKDFMAATDHMLLKPMHAEFFERLGEGWWVVKDNN